MTLTVKRAVRREVWAGWPTVGREAMIESSKVQELREELLLYLDGTASGRSVLISGHRGAGKTMAVESVVDTIRRDIFRKIAGGGTVPACRPVLVRLHGPSLLARPIPEPPPNGGHATDGDASPADTGKTEPAAAGRDPIQSALEQITIALYRAVASEFVQAMLTATELAVKRRAEQGRSAGDLLEIPARLRLDLDAGAEPAALRILMSRVDTPAAALPPSWPGLGLTLREGSSTSPRGPEAQRLATGILWPLERARIRGDLGFQEIVAMASISQAFKVCTGKVTASEKRTDSEVREQKRDTVAALGLQDAVQKLFALAAGTAVGVGVGTAGGATAGAVAGLAAALTATVSLSWSSSRSRKGERSLEYSFLPDRSVQTLDRDLPQIIDRFREVGLAPVFVVDEIDKLPDPDEPLQALMKRLKQLTSDNGFFCFLTDRGYFDLVETRLRESVYPIEHSYYTHRLLVAHRAADVADFLRKAIVAGPQPASDSTPSTVAALMLGRIVMHRSELNTTSLIRALSACVGAEQVVREDEARLRSIEMNRLDVIVQLAIEQALRRRDIADRIEADARFVQIATDVFYLVSRTWRRGAPGVDVSPAKIKEYLAARTAPRNLALQEDLLTSGDLSAFAFALRSMADLLCDFEKLRAALKADPGLAEQDAPILAVFTPPLAPLLRRDNAGTYSFCWDRYGLVVPAVAQEQDLDVVDRVRRILEKLDATDLPLDEIVAVGLLPSTVTAIALTEAQTRLKEAQDDDPRRATDIERLNSFYDAVCLRGPALQAMLGLMRHIITGSLGPVPKERGNERKPGTVLRALHRYIDVKSIEKLSGNDLLQALDGQLQGAAQVLSPLSLAPEPRPDTLEWEEEIARIPPFSGTNPQDATSWRFWFARVRDHFDGNSVGPARLVDVALAASDQPPGCLFGRDLSKLGIADWSRIVLETTELKRLQPWAVVAGLYSLGFGQELLLAASNGMASLKRPSNRTDISEDSFARHLAERAPRSDKGLLQIVSRPDTSIEPRQPGDPPILRIHIDDLGRYARALEILQRWTAFAGVTDDGLS